MKLLKIAVEGLPLFNGKCEIDFIAQQRVSAQNAESMTLLFSNGLQNYYQKNVLAFTGINASGKTMTLRLIAFVGKFLSSRGVNDISNDEIFACFDDNDKAVFDIYFYGRDDNVHLLHSEIVQRSGKFVISAESLSSKPRTDIKNKATIYDFCGIEPVFVRKGDETYLPDDVSIIIAFNKSNKESFYGIDTLGATNINRLLFDDSPSEILSFLDPTVEYLKSIDKQNGGGVELKFFERPEIHLDNMLRLNRYLSSGTIRGLNIFSVVGKMLKCGGMLLIDEIENHFNREIVSTLIKFFMDKQVNPHGAVLVLSTHYAELLDEFDRNDNIYVVQNKGGIHVENLSTLLSRNDIKRSEAYQSGLLGDTAPSYEAYMALKKRLIASAQEVD